MQAGDGEIGRRVRVVDGVHVAPANEGLAAVELPAEERVDGAQNADHLLPHRRCQEVVVHRVALVHGLLRVEVHDHEFGTHPEAAREDVEAIDSGLQVHQALL